MHRPFLFAPAVLAAVALLAVPLSEARADISFRDIVGEVVKGVGAAAVETALNGRDGKEEFFMADEDYIDPSRYTVSDERAFSPTDDVFCYGRQQLCFGSNGALSPEWTDTIYGAGPSLSGD